MITFGSGALICTPTNLADGSAIANPTPVKLGVLQEVTLDLSVDIKTLHGAGMYPVAVAQGKAKAGIKAKYADVSGAVLGSLFLGQAASAGIKDAVIDFSASVPGSVAYTITVAPPSSGTFVADLGVFNASTGASLTRVASAPTTGQYSVSAGGVYTFASADANLPVLISYEYSASSTTAKNWTLNNRLMGYTPSFSVILRETYDGRVITAKFHRAVSGKLALPFKSDDFAVPDFEAEFFASPAGQVGWICVQGE